jgi:DNA invertase Pin-like site-specific DNA recombinase
MMAHRAKPAALPEPLVPAIGYVRVSMMREEAISPETQQAAIEDSARRRGRRITDWVVDLDKTGRNFRRRIMEAIARVESAGPGDPREIIVWKYSRFGRDRAGIALNLARLEKAGGQLQSATEEVDAKTATGKFTRGMLFEVAAFESDRAAETWHEVYQYRVADGLPPAGRARFGYVRLGRIPHETDPQRTRRDLQDRAGERYAEDPRTGKVLTAMYRAYAGGEGGPAIAARLNESFTANTYGKPWSARTVLDVLDSGFGAGLLRIHDPSCRCGRPGRCRTRVWVRGKHEAVITEDEWQAYLSRRESARTIPPRHRSPVYPVSGLVRCAHCEGAMVAGGAREFGGAYFRCSRHRHYGNCPGHPVVPVSAVIDHVHEWVAGVAADIDTAAASEARMAVRLSARISAERVTRELAAADRELVRLALRRAEDSEGVLPGTAWEGAARELTATRARLEAELLAAKRQEQEAEADPLPLMTGILEAWDTLPAGDLGIVLRKVIRRIEISRVSASRSRNEKGQYGPGPSARIDVIPVWVTGP